MRPCCAKFALEFPLGMQNVDTEKKGKHTTSPLGSLNTLFIVFPATRVCSRPLRN